MADQTAEPVLRDVTSADLGLYRAFLLRGLTEDEESFRISPEDEMRGLFPTGDAPDSFTIGVYAGGKLAGVASFERDGQSREKLRHKGTAFRMYVSPEFRGRGFARLLLGELIRRARNLPEMEQMNLTVLAHNAPAKRVYESLGFRSFALERNALKWKGKYFDEEQMVLFL